MRARGTFINSQELRPSNLNLLKFFMRIGESFVSIDRAREFCGQQLLFFFFFFFPAGLDKKGKKTLEYGVGFGGPRTTRTPRLFKTNY